MLVLDEDDGGKAEQHHHDDHLPSCGPHTLLAGITLVSGAPEHAHSLVTLLLAVSMFLTCRP